MLELIQKIKTATEAGCILEEMELFNELEELHNDTMSLMATAIDLDNTPKDKESFGFNMIIDGDADNVGIKSFYKKVEKMRTKQQKVITKEALDNDYEIVGEFTYSNGADLTECQLCSSVHADRLKTESSWTSAAYCNNCNTISFVIRADRQGGNCSETVYSYKS